MFARQYSKQSLLTFLLYWAIVSLGFVSTLASRATFIVLGLCFLTALVLAGPALIKQYIIRYRLLCGFIALFFAWSLLTTFWANSFGISLASVGRLSLLAGIGTLAIIGAAIINREATLKPFGGAVLVAIAIATVIMGVEYVFGYPIIASIKGELSDHAYYLKLAHGLPVISALLISGLYWNVSRHDGLRRALWFLVFAVTAVLVMLNSTDAVKLAIVAAGLAIVFSYYLPATFMAILLTYLATLILFPVIITVVLPDGQTLPEWISYLKHSWAHRLLIYQEVTTLIQMKPILGWGFDMSRVLSEGLDPVTWQQFTDNPKQPVVTRVGDALPLHPHALPAQVWLEVGAIGILIWAGMISILGKMLWQLRNIDRTYFAFFVGLFTNLAIISNISFGAWQGWWVATIFLSIFVLILVRGPDRISQE